MIKWFKEWPERWYTRDVLKCRKCGSKKQFIAGTGHCRPCLEKNRVDFRTPPTRRVGGYEKFDKNTGSYSAGWGRNGWPDDYF